MKKQFLEEGKGKLDLLRDDDGDIALTSTEWLKENPFGVRSDWECHVIARGAPMYRLMLIKRQPQMMKVVENFIFFLHIV